MADSGAGGKLTRQQPVHSLSTTTAEHLSDAPVNSREDAPDDQNALGRGDSLFAGRFLPSKPALITTVLSQPVITALRPAPRHSGFSPSRSMSSRVRLLVASLGNPPPYHSTRHSAGHILLQAFASHLQFPRSTKNKEWGNGFLSTNPSRPEYTLWQSASSMNISGVGALKAWRSFLAAQSTEQDIVHGLVVFHDELELAPGTLKVRRAQTSAKGHNGIKSVQNTFASAGVLGKIGGGFVKIGVGIGRPVSRDTDDVSAYVLGQITAAERLKIEGCVGELERMLEDERGRIDRK